MFFSRKNKIKENRLPFDLESGMNFSDCLYRIKHRFNNNISCYREGNNVYVLKFENSIGKFYLEKIRLTFTRYRLKLYGIQLIFNKSDSLFDEFAKLLNNKFKSIRFSRKTYIDSIIWESKYIAASLISKDSTIEYSIVDKLRKFKLLKEQEEEFINTII